MRTTQFIVLTPAGKPDAGMAIAACRAGALGILDLEYADPTAANEAVQQLRRFTTADFGIKIGAAGAAVLADLGDVGRVANLPSNPRQVGNLPHGSLAICLTPRRSSFWPEASGRVWRRPLSKSAASAQSCSSRPPVFPRPCWASGWASTPSC